MDFAGRPGNENNSENRSGDEDFELPLFGLSKILEATNNFSLNNKLGECGFGPVYKVFYDYMTFYVVHMVLMIICSNKMIHTITCKCLCTRVYSKMRRILVF
ncbi:putative non-specific serine/threonine protein kinase [Helianthus anomalus]